MDLFLSLLGFKEDGAVLRDEKGRDLLWPRDLLPSDLKVGDKIAFSLAKEGDKKNNEDLARNILNEILNTPQ